MMLNNSTGIQVTLLGTGTSTGIPVIGCSCKVCTSPDPHDRRLRCSCLVVANGISLLIDAGPDFRTQALSTPIEKVDAVLITHHHFDHVAGLDDLRPYFFGNRNPIPCYANADTAGTLNRMFWYIFEDGSYPGVSKLELLAVDNPFDVQSRYQADKTVAVTPIPAYHGKLPIFGYRVGNFAYLTDTSAIPDASMDLLRGVEILVLDALRHEPHPTHFTISESVKIAQQIGARQTYLTHMTHSIKHQEEDAKLPEGIDLGYDGLYFEIN